MQTFKQRVKSFCPVEMSKSFSNQEYSVYVGNLETRVTEEILWELFLQAGPLDRVHIPKDRETGKAKPYGFVEFTNEISVQYACRLFNGTPLYQRQLKVNPSGSGSSSSPGNQSPNWSPYDRSQDWASNGQSTPLGREGNFSVRSSPNFQVYHNNMVTPDNCGTLQHSRSFPGNLQERRSSWQQQQQQYEARTSPSGFSPHHSGQHSPLHLQAMNNMQQGRFNSPFFNQFTPPNRGNWRR